MKRLMNNLFIAAMILLSSLTYAQTGLLFKVSQSGATASADVILCLNGKGSLSCQNYHVSAQNLAIRTTINRSYPAAGIKVLTPGYRVTGCTPYSNGQCLFAVNGETPSSITVKENTPSAYTVGGQVNGLLGTVVLETNGGDALTLNADGAFTFPTALPTGSTYAVVVQSQPATQTCTVNNGTGTITNANVTNVAVTCSTNTRTVGGSVSGLGVAESVVLQNNGTDDLTLNANGGFTFSTPVAQGATYNVTILTQPGTQTCSVMQGSGTAGASNITNVQVTCATNAYTVGGTVSGLSGTVVLQNNGADDLSAGANGPFTFSTPVAQGAAYNVTVLTQPATQTCTVTNGSGTMGGSNVTNVGVSCALNTTTLSTSISTLVLSVTGLTEYGVSGTPASGTARVITITNTGSYTAANLVVTPPTWPAGTTNSTSCGSTLAAGATCTITVTPGNTATTNGTNPCSNGTAPVPGVVQVSADNATTVSTNVVVLRYGCIYQGGYVFAFDDTTSTAGSVGGKVMSTSDQVAAGPNGIVWASRGTTGNGNAGNGNPDVSKDTIPGVSQTSTSASSHPTYASFAAAFAATYNNPNPFAAASFSACNGNLDGSCNTGNILVMYNQFITNYVNPGPGPFNASAGPTILTYYAAGLCRQTIATYSDWYLPAICEMGFDRTAQGSGCGTLATPTLQNIQSSLRGIAAFATPDGVYWSSTERAATPQTTSWYQSFATNATSVQGVAGKGSMYGVRCARRLT